MHPHWIGPLAPYLPFSRQTHDHPGAGLTKGVGALVATGVGYVAQMGLTPDSLNRWTLGIATCVIGVYGIIRVGKATADGKAFRIKEEAEKGTNLLRIAELEQEKAAAALAAAAAARTAADALEEKARADARVAEVERREAAKDDRIIALEFARDHDREIIDQLSAEGREVLKRWLEERGHVSLGPAAAGAAAEAVVKAITRVTPDPDAPPKGEARP